MTKWEHIILEGFCMYGSMKDKRIVTYSFDKVEDLWKKKGKKQIRDNPVYLPGKRPAWCRKKFKGRKERTPEIKCLCHGKKQQKCPFFSFSDVLKEDRDVFEFAYHVKGETCFDDDWELDKKKFKKFLGYILDYENKNKKNC